ncbi:MAG TPA: DUF3574 domain-containing protein [Xanthobacteraceae bacterium]|jgi:hypothetical protein
MTRAALVLGALILQTAVAAAQTTDCTAPQQRMLAIDLLFGRGSGGLSVSEQAWTQFLAREISPRFPDGLTVIDASGQWRNPQGGAIVRERSKVVVIVAPENPPVQDRIDAIAAAYRRQFKQQSVGIVIRSACASF